MLTIFQSRNDNIVCLSTNDMEKGSWINLVNPSEEELQTVAQNTGIYYDFLKYPLDDEELPRVEIEDNNQVLIIINVPAFHKKDLIYDTFPLGIVLTEDYFVTICLQPIDILKEFAQGKIKGLATFKKTRFVFQIMQKTANLYLKYLREINKKTDEIEYELQKSMRNKELIRLLDLEKSLVYFTTSLRSNEKVMEKLLRGKTLKMYEEDQDLLEDVIIENKQAIEMADIYSNILSGMMDAFASIISNNLNIVMKFLASITIVLALPTMVASFFGMNVQIPFQNSPHGFFIVLSISLVLSVLSVMFLIKRNMF
ncbi:magnesium transporter CorA family protein [Dehalobacterium formicoaceticum]|uniref:Magnesium transporter CorA family protein n=1 Tax=Dehalobacterium formicoaceticum TaxID=51515 RepID=A0ABT1Y660_9FIRM|nr:magnesium transporter CorA family protein [Dehalobacterium formicoaceticum]MCR6546375.1 magnesium transporter CorA family protein [Dehalobacterium formicoaceticum]